MQFNWTVGIAAVALAALLAAAQGAPAADESALVQARLPVVTITPGGSAELVATVIIQEGYRIQANPTPGPYLLPTMLVLEPAGGVHAEGPVYPPGKPFSLEDDDFKFSGYSGTIKIRVPLKATANAVPGEYTMNGRLRYQLSTDSSFTRKATLPLKLTVKVIKKSK